MAFDAPYCFEAIAPGTSFTHRVAGFVLVWSDSLIVCVCEYLVQLN